MSEGKMLSNYLISTTLQKVLRFLLMYPGRLCYEREIARGARVSYGSANYILNKLHKEGILQRKTEGRMCHYSIDMSNPFIKELKILNNLLLLEPLLQSLKRYARKVVLYGSWASGTDTQESDIDLYIVAAEKDKVLSIIKKYSYSSKVNGKKIQAIIDTPVDLLKKEKREKVFMDQVEQGNILWEREIDENNL